MPWAALDDGFHSHPKILAAGLDGAGLYARALSYCAHHLTDGHVPAAWVKEAAPAKTARAVTAAGLWQETDGGYVIPDYTEFNPTREHVEKHRSELSRKRAEAGRKGAASRWGNEATSEKLYAPHQIGGEGETEAGRRDESPANRHVADGKRHGKRHGKADGNEMANACPPTPTPIGRGKSSRSVARGRSAPGAPQPRYHDLADELRAAYPQELLEHYLHNDPTCTVRDGRIYLDGLLLGPPIPETT